MFGNINIPYESVMLYNTATLKPGVDFDDVEMAVAIMCSLVKETYPDFIAGQVFKYAGFISDEGTVGKPERQKNILLLLHIGNLLRHMKKVTKAKHLKMHFPIL